MNLKLGLPVGAIRQRIQRVLIDWSSHFPELLGLCCCGLLAFCGLDGILPAMASLKLVFDLLLSSSKRSLWRVASLRRTADSSISASSRAPMTAGLGAPGDSTGELVWQAPARPLQ